MSGTLRILFLLLIVTARAAVGAPAPTFSAALSAVVGPSPAALDAVQKAVDDGWPADGARLLETLQTNRSALDLLAQAVDAGATDIPADTPRSELSKLRLVLALTLIDAQRATAAGDTAACELDLRTLAGAARVLLAVPRTPPRIIGISVAARAAAQARRARVPLALSLPPLADLVAFEKKQYLADADKAAQGEGELGPHIRAAAARLAPLYYDPLARPMTQAEIETLVERFTALYSDLGKLYGVMDPKKVTELIPSPVPPPQKLGETIASVVLCARFLDTRLLVRRYLETERVLKGAP